jgi:predicted site-specific integrase-resolvase
MTQEMVTIKVACDTLKVSRKTIYRYIEKGLLTKIKEGRRTYILANDIRSLRQGQIEKVTQSKRDSDTKKVTHMTLPIEEYKSVMEELAELKERNKLLLEYKLTGDQVRKELEETKQKLQAAETEIARLKKPLFKRIVKQVIKK